VRFTYVFSGFSREGAALTRSIRATSRLNEALRTGIGQEVSLVRRQLDEMDQSFPNELMALDNDIARTQIEYLKLDIDKQERLTVEKIKSLQSELGVESLSFFELLRQGSTPQAKNHLVVIESLQKQIQEGFEELHNLQMDKLESIQNQLDRSISMAYRTIYALASALLLTLLIFLVLLRSRVISPLKSIDDATVQVRDGDFSARATVRRLDEIGQVAQGFNFMADSLLRSYADLERKVQERTNQIRQLQQEIVQTAKMSAVGQMISGVAHELNNPLTVIMGYTELTRVKRASKGGDPEELKLMNEVYLQADRCRKIVANLLQFARKATPAYENIKANDLAEQALKLREYEFQTRNVIFIREYESNNPEFYADKNSIQQVLLNLINNAYDAIRDTGRAGTIWVRTEAFDNQVMFQISDDGTGLSEPERIFEPFYTTKEVGRGTGLGLSVCYGIIKEHNGVITAANWDRGARFTVMLPCAADKRPAQSAPQIEKPATSGLRRTALVVDDEPAIVDLQKSFLSEIGVDAFGVKSGQEAIRFLENRQVDLVISDVRMSGPVDGLKLFKWLERDRPDLRDRFIFVTGDSVGLTTGELLGDRSVPHIEKPFTFDAYSNIVRAVLEGPRSHNGAVGR
jgi:signal transduction histidine kinase/ActR/RegA family two-component response regulator